MPRLRFSGGSERPRSVRTTASSPKWIDPSSGASSPATIRSVVDLPQPLGPSSVNTSPSATSSERPSTAFWTLPG